MFGRKSFLEKCKKTFDKHNLILFRGLYPCCYDDNKNRSGEPTRQQLFVCDLLFKKKIPFIIEYKIIAQCFNHFYCDIMAQGKHHKFCLEIDGNQHYLNKKQIIRDLKKEIYLVEHHNITTERISNEIVDNYPFDKKPLDNILKVLKIRLFKNENQFKFMKEKIGELKCEMCRVKRN